MIVIGAGQSADDVDKGAVVVEREVVVVVLGVEDSVVVVFSVVLLVRVVVELDLLVVVELELAGFTVLTIVVLAFVDVVVEELLTVVEDIDFRFEVVTSEETEVDAGWTTSGAVVEVREEETSGVVEDPEELANRATVALVEEELEANVNRGVVNNNANPVVKPFVAVLRSDVVGDKDMDEDEGEFKVYSPIAL